MFFNDTTISSDALPKGKGRINHNETIQTYNFNHCSTTCHHVAQDLPTA